MIFLRYQTLQTYINYLIKCTETVTPTRTHTAHLRQGCLLTANYGFPSLASVVDLADGTKSTPCNTPYILQANYAPA